jgi:hypothetical protein
MNLSGTWSFALDPADVGVAERWFARSLSDEIQLPGSLQAQGYGDEVSVDTQWVGGIIDRSWFTEERYAQYREPGNVKVPFWLQPDRHYIGVAWYCRDIEIPDAWRGRRITLQLERPHWGTQVWIDERAVGTCDSLSTPHAYDLGGDLAPGRHRIAIRVDNRMLVTVGKNAHSVSDHTQSNWNGIVGAIELTAGDQVWIDDLQIFPDVAGRAMTVRVRIGNAGADAGEAQLTLQATAPDGTHLAPVTVDAPFAADGAAAEVHYPLGADARLWDEFSPALYRLDATLVHGAASATRSDTFGLREVSVIGTQIAVNGRPIFLRGTLECAIFPHTGYPPTDIDAWRRIIRICQAHGLNHIRFHSWCPPAAAFAAADELGCYLQVECAAWVNQGASLGDGQPIDAWLYREAARIIRAYGNHPSFILMAYGNEPGGPRHPEYLARWVNYWREHEPRRLHTSGAGWPAIPENDYHNIPEPRVQRWGEELRSRINGLPPETHTDYRDYVERLGKPIVSHEIGQWCVFPNFDEIGKYTGVLKAKNFEIFRDTLAANHMGDQAHDFLIASGKLQTLCYKEDIESALRTQGFAGFQLLDLHDFPGQGTALVGVLDPFWEEKGYVTPQEFRRFCNSTAPLARMAKRYWRTSETFSAVLDVAHYGPAAITSAANWRLLDADGATVAHGTLPPAEIPTGGVRRLGAITIPLGAIAPARRYTLAVAIDAANVENDWDIWVFGDTLETAAPAGITIAATLTEALEALERGGRVLLLPDPATLRIESEIGFSSVFWNTAWTKRDTGTQMGQAPHTLGIVCDPAHPALAHFPTESHSNWQWWEIIHGAAAMVLNDLPSSLRPIIQPIDTWFDSRRLGLVLEARVGAGRLLICSADLQSDLETRLVARQLRHSLLEYMASESFAPRHALSATELASMWASETRQP